MKVRVRAPSVPASQQRGFTLVEMLVALFVFGLIAASAVAVMAYAIDNQDVVRGRAEEVAAFQRARALLRADLGQAAVRRVRDANGQAARRAFVAGGPDAPVLLGFVRRGWNNPEGEARASMQYVEYRIVEGRLERRTRPALDGAAMSAPQVLLEGVHSARVRYRFRGDWLEGWPGGADTLPDAIALDLELDGFGRVEQLFLVPAVPA
ncbi:type II secretion system minor pseudopilin GspJ [Marilutibacter aestuarii]|uniref:Type II secretion system protein J n=1 Tax=Marilutibacter aestuarii TaxID=1706195 RepID=A0A508ANU5_9GAMM|nr:type II secretion system minor pseudopilin GspJ [Lysobacter aestuarii]TQD51137.1 type II secretion system protein GspJ [Lysobacter aestuarii]